jgi:hypothetical protein
MLLQRTVGELQLSKRADSVSVAIVQIRQRDEGAYRELCVELLEANQLVHHLDDRDLAADLE